jgi:hypothetical protein
LTSPALISQPAARLIYGSNTPARKKELVIKKYAAITIINAAPKNNAVIFNIFFFINTPAIRLPPDYLR